jgi:hypothetical protein
MIDISMFLNPKGIIDAFARLKGISVAKVVRNASRDFAQAAHKETPIAKIGRSEYYKYFDKSGQPHFLHESMVVGRKSRKGLRKVRVYKGWSRASWLGIFRALGVSMRIPVQRLPNQVEHISHAITRGDQTNSTVTMTDYIHFDSFGRGQDTRTEAVARAGFMLAAKRITTEMSKMLRSQWRS